MERPNFTKIILEEKLKISEENTTVIDEFFHYSYIDQKYNNLSLKPYIYT